MMADWSAAGPGSKNVPARSGLPSVGRNSGSISAVTGENDWPPTRIGSWVYANAPIDANDRLRVRHSATSVSLTSADRREVWPDWKKLVTATSAEGARYGTDRS